MSDHHPSSGATKLELHVEETSPHSIHMVVTAATILTTLPPSSSSSSSEGMDDHSGSNQPTQATTQPSRRQQQRGFVVTYFNRSKSFLGAISGTEIPSVKLQFAPSQIKGVVALVDGGYDNESQTSPERKLELSTDEKYPMVVGEWVLPREKHERPLRIDIITGALQALLSEH